MTFSRLLVISVLFLTVFSFDKNKWKFCKDFEHCTYHRSRLSEQRHPLILASVPSLTHGELTISVVSHDDPAPITVSLLFYDQCIVRLQANNEVDRYHSNHAISMPSPIREVDCHETNSMMTCTWTAPRHANSCHVSLSSTPSSPFSISLSNIDINSHHFLYLSPTTGTIALDFEFPTSTAFYGLPEHALDLKLPDTIGSDEPIRMFNLDVFQYETDSKFPLYGSVPFLISRSVENEFSGVYWNNPSDTFVDLNGTISYFYSESGALDVIFLTGPSIYDLFHQFRFIFGPFPSPPTFSLGYHQCRWNYRDETDVLTVLKEFEDRDLPVDTLWLDIEHTDKKKYFTFDKKHFPDPEGLQDHLWKYGRRMVTISDPHIKKDTSYHVYKSGISRDVFVKTADQNKVFEGHCWPGTSVYVDFLNPEGRKFWSEQYLKSNYKYKTDTLNIWNDMNEPSVFNHAETTMPRDLLHFDGTKQVLHRDVHNLYGFLMHEATYHGLLSDNPNVRPFVLTRSFFAGSGRSGVAVWTGDNTAEWSHLKASVPMLLTLSLSGLGFSGADVGGFFNHPDAELQTRWYQLGAWYPFYRGHSHLDNPRREPWLFGHDAERRIRRALVERYSYIPYWKFLFYRYENEGIPPLLPLFVNLDNDSSEVFFVGDDILVVPVTKSGITRKEIDIPIKNDWFDVRNGNHVTFPHVFDISLDTIPVLQRAGSIIPRRKRLRRSTEYMNEDPLSLDVALSKGKAKGIYYGDDGISFGYKKGIFDLAEIEFQNSKLCWNVSTAGYQSILIERVTLVGSQKPRKIVDDDGNDVYFYVLDSQLIIKNPMKKSNFNWCLHFKY
ncbi:hypothetical protein P9112_003943 [Eukaryota sp. TZLM1-RC]